MGTVLQLGLGTVYAWSFFQKPMKAHFALSVDAPVAWIFCLSIFALGLAAAAGGMLLPRFGPRRLALTGAVLYPLGWMLGGIGLSTHRLAWLYVGYGLVGGIGLGLAYVTPVATVAKWFPDRKGLATGMVLMGFGLGAFLMSKVIGPVLFAAFDGKLSSVFFLAGLGIAALCIPAALFLRNPPVAGVASAGVSSPATASPSVRRALLSTRFAIMWLVFFCNICAGILFIGFQSPMLQGLLKRADAHRSPADLAVAGATLIAVSSLCNGIGRLFWGWVADRIGRIQVFRILLGSQVVVFLGLLTTRNPWLFSGLVCYVMLCYGGGFGTMPSFVLDTFGAKLMPEVYGAILTAWSMAGIVGPQMAAFIQDRSPEHAGAATFTIAAALLAVGFGTSLLLKSARTLQG
jgi:OFA family oxalate/formate antiporter-like MFS transporter